MGFPLIKYNSDQYQVDFNRYFNEFNAERRETTAQTESSSGVTETLDFFEKYYVFARRNKLDQFLLSQLERWYEYVKDGSSFKLWWNRYLGAYMSFEGSLKTNDEVNATFTRSGAAYFINPVSGLVESAAENNPRYEAGKFGRGLLMEGGATNILTHSEQFDNAAWTKTNVTVNANTSEVLDPNDGNTADKLTASAANGLVYQDTATAITTHDGIFSIWLRALSQSTNNIKLYIEDDIGGELAYEVITVTSEWVRYDIDYDNGAASNPNNWRVKFIIVNNGDIIYAWGAQLEVGSPAITNRTFFFPTSYIQTVAAAASSSLEDCYWALDSNILDPNRGTISFWFKPSWAYDDGKIYVLFETVDAGNNSRLYITKHSDNKLYFLIMLADDTNYISVSIAADFLTQDDWNYITVTWDTSISNGLKIYHNGSLKETSTNSPSTAKQPTKLYIGCEPDHAFFAFGIFDEFLIEKEVQPASEILARYNNDRAMGYRRNYFSALELVEPEFNPILYAGSNRYDIEIEAVEVLS
jgi:hypothetical protein